MPENEYIIFIGSEVSNRNNTNFLQHKCIPSAERMFKSRCKNTITKDDEQRPAVSDCAGTGASDQTRRRRAHTGTLGM